MDSAEILRLRLQNTGLCDSRFDTAAQAVSHLGAVQSQDFAAAKWALGLRVGNSTDESIEDAFNQGSILRTHVLRPTWHFVTPQNIRWMLELTAPRVKQVMASYNRKLELNDALFAKANKALRKALRGHSYLTRQELKSVLEGAGIQTNVQRLAHILIWPELDGLICSGPLRGKQLTYALLEERVPEAKRLEAEEARAKLAAIYFKSHGPAQLQDFSWWSGLAMKDVNNALDPIKSKLAHSEIHSKTYWFYPDAESCRQSQRAFLLSIYDEYTIAYKDRSDLSETRDVTRMMTKGNSLNSVIILNNKVAGTWRKIQKKDSIEISLQPFRKLKNAEARALQSEIDRYGKFTGRPVTLKTS